LHRKPARNTLRIAFALIGFLSVFTQAGATAAPPEEEPALAPAWRAYREGRTEEARELLASQPEAARESAGATLLSGLLYLDEGNAEEAELTFARVPLAHPLGLAARYNRALAFVQLNQPGDAVYAARTIADALPSLPKARREAAGAAIHNTAMALLAGGHPKRARELFRLIIESLPGTGAARSARKMLDARKRDAAPALQSCVKSYRAKEYRRARRCFAQLVEQHGPSAEILYAMGYADFQLGKYRRAATKFEGALIANPRDGDALFMLAMARAHLGQDQTALGLFQDALAVGLSAEDPDEARRHIRTLTRLIANRVRRGWVMTADAGAGYDSNPRPTGAASAASTSYGDDAPGTGFARVLLGAEYRQPHARSERGKLRGLTTLGYGLTQRVLFSDFAKQDTSAAGRPRRHESLSELSLQTHTAFLDTRLMRGAWTGKLRASGSVDLSGLRTFGPLLAHANASPRTEYAWSRHLSTQVGAGYTAQKSLDEGIDYLTGYGIFAEVGQAAQLGSRLRVEVSYRAVAWWLGTFEQSNSDCASEEPCALSVPYSNHMHRPALSLEASADSGLAVEAEVALERRVYWDEGLYRTASDVEVTEERRDLATCFAVEARIPVATDVRLLLGADYTRNRSSIDVASTGIDEGYDRFEVSAQLSYRK